MSDHGLDISTAINENCDVRVVRLLICEFLLVFNINMYPDPMLPEIYWFENMGNLALYRVMVRLDSPCITSFQCSIVIYALPPFLSEAKSKLLKLKGKKVPKRNKWSKDMVH